jgi:hypothetical protein
MNMKALSRLFLILAMLGIAFGAMGLVSPVLAQDNDPVPLPDPGNGDGDVVIIPDTGSSSEDPGLFSFWTILIILGVVIVVLLIAVLARGSSSRL